MHGATDMEQETEALETSPPVPVPGVAPGRALSSGLPWGPERRAAES